MQNVDVFQPLSLFAFFLFEKADQLQKLITVNNIRVEIRFYGMRNYNILIFQANNVCHTKRNLATKCQLYH